MNQKDQSPVTVEQSLTILQGGGSLTYKTRNQYTKRQELVGHISTERLRSSGLLCDNRHQPSTYPGGEDQPIVSLQAGRHYLSREKAQGSSNCGQACQQQIDSRKRITPPIGSYLAHVESE